LDEEEFIFKGNLKIIFLTQNFIVENYLKTKKQNSWPYTRLTFHLKTNIVKIELEKEKAEWLQKIISENTFENPKRVTLQQIKNDFENSFDDFELFWFSKPIQQLKENGVILSL
jgi:hypothetical protein